MTYVQEKQAPVTISTHLQLFLPVQRNLYKLGFQQLSCEGPMLDSNDRDHEAASSRQTRTYWTATLPPLSREFSYAGPHLLHKAPHSLACSKSGQPLWNLELLKVEKHYLTGLLVCAPGTGDHLSAPHRVVHIHADNIITVRRAWMLN